MKSRSGRNFFIYFLVLITLVLVVVLLIRPQTGSGMKPLSWVIAEAQTGNVKRIAVDDDNLKVYLIDQVEPVISRKESSSSMEEILRGNDVAGGTDGVEVEISGGGRLDGVLGAFISFLPLIILGALILFMMRQAGGANNQSGGAFLRGLG